MQEMCRRGDGFLQENTLLRIIISSIGNIKKQKQPILVFSQPQTTAG